MGRPPQTITVDFANLPDEPSFPAAESAVLGAVMLSPTCAAKLLPLLRQEHFSSAPHRDTLAAIQTLAQQQKPIDPVLVHDQLRKDGHVTWAGQRAALFLTGCIDATYYPGNGTSYAAIVLKYAARRRAVQAGIRIAQAAARGASDLPDLMRTMAAEVRDIADQASTHARVATPPRAPVALGTVAESLRHQLRPPTLDISEPITDV